MVDPHQDLDPAFLKGQLVALQGIVSLLLKIHVFHAQQALSKREILDAWTEGISYSDLDLTERMREGFEHTNRWLDLSLTGGSLMPHPDYESDK